ncbi:MAG TPA: hypothetical protein VF144_04445, partial [Chitinophagaceae bacterium]
FWGCKKTERLATPPPPATTVTASVAGNIIDLNNAPVSGALVAAGVSTAGRWGATATLKGDTLTVAYNDIMLMSDFDNAVYLKKP